LTSEQFDRSELKIKIKVWGGRRERGEEREERRRKEGGGRREEGGRRRDIDNTNLDSTTGQTLDWIV
jgi:hypothetical protein